MISLFVENLALGLIGLYPSEQFATFVLTILDPFYRWAINLGL